MRRIFFVDFENVHDSGLDGIELLNSHDLVMIFYSSCANKIDMDILTHTKAKIEFVKAECGTANALDFQLVFYLCKRASRLKKLFIVSKDKGYFPVISLLRNEGINVSRNTSIKLLVNTDNKSEIECSENVIKMDFSLSDSLEENDDPSYYQEKKIRMIL